MVAVNDLLKKMIFSTLEMSIRFYVFGSIKIHQKQYFKGILSCHFGAL
jgi:hypothetical protein